MTLSKGSATMNRNPKYNEKKLLMLISTWVWLEESSFPKRSNNIKHVDLNRMTTGFDSWSQLTQWPLSKLPAKVQLTISEMMIPRSTSKHDIWLVKLTWHNGGDIKIWHTYIYIYIHTYVYIYNMWFCMYIVSGR